jgi:hypothetical protein
LTNITAAPDLTQAAADAMNVWLADMAQNLAYVQALDTSINRAQGAAMATNRFWETAQMNAAVEYEAQLAGDLDQEPTLRSNVEFQLVASGFPTVTLSQWQVTTNQAVVATNGLDAGVQAMLTQFGADSTTITNLQYAYLEQDPIAEAGTFPQSLTNPALDLAVQNAASVLRAAALTLINVAILPSGQIRFDLPTEPGFTYNIRFNQNLANLTGWTNVLTINATANLLSFTNTMDAGVQTGFYQASQN